MPSVATRVTPEEYLERERKADWKSEYRCGEIVSMDHSTISHSLIVTNVLCAIAAQLTNSPCEVFASNLRLSVPTANFFTYPDLMVTCGELQIADEHDDIVLNPIVLIEVLSKSTQDYDRGEKFASYRNIPTLQEYLTIDQYKVHVEQWSRQPDEQWLSQEFHDPNAMVRLASVRIELQVADIYRRVNLK